MDVVIPFVGFKFWKTYLSYIALEALELLFKLSGEVEPIIELFSLLLLLKGSNDVF